jgi:hypothetical protein
MNAGPNSWISWVPDFLRNLCGYLSGKHEWSECVSDEQYGAK